MIGDYLDSSLLKVISLDLNTVSPTYITLFYASYTVYGTIICVDPFLGLLSDLLAIIDAASCFLRCMDTLKRRLYIFVTWKKLLGVKPPDGPITYSD